MQAVFLFNNFLHFIITKTMIAVNDGAAQPGMLDLCPVCNLKNC